MKSQPAMPPHIWRDGRRYLSMTQLALERRCSRQAAGAYAKRRPAACVRIGAHTYFCPLWSEVQHG